MWVGKWRHKDELGRRMEMSERKRKGKRNQQRKKKWKKKLRK